MAVDDLWYSRTNRDSNGDRVKLKRHGRGKRWRVRNTGSSDAHFDKFTDAETLDKEREGRIVAGKLPVNREAGTALVRDAVVKAVNAEHRSKKLTAESRRKYLSAARRLADPFFADMTMREVTPVTILEWKGWMAEQTTRAGKPYGVSSVEVAWVVVGKAFRHCVDSGGIERHPYIGVARVEANGPRPVVPWEDERVAALMPHLSPRAVGPVVVATGCGTRPSESLAVSVKDFRVKPGKLRVRHQVMAEWTPDGPVLRLTKNKRERFVPVAKATTSMVEEHARRFGTITVRCECHDEDVTLLFHCDGKPWTYLGFNGREWIPAMKRAGLYVVAETAPVKDTPTDTPVIVSDEFSLTGRDSSGLRLVDEHDHADDVVHKSGMHQLRHWWASAEIRDGVQATELMKSLGHKRLETTVGYYVHLFAAQEANATARLDTRAHGMLLPALSGGAETPADGGMRVWAQFARTLTDCRPAELVGKRPADGSAPVDDVRSA